MEEKYNCRALYFAPVDKKYFHKWEYYRVDKRMLEDTFSEVVFSNSFIKAIYFVLFSRPKLMYFWWWHRSLPIILICKIFRIRVVGTGAVHMFDESGSSDFYSKSVVYRLLNRLAWRLAEATLFISKSQSGKLFRMKR